MLKDIMLKETYRTGIDDLLEEFYIPCLKQSRTYLRATGFFNSSILNYIGNGIHNIVEKEGKIKMICGAQLTKWDLDQIIKGYEEKKILENNIENQINDIFNENSSINVKNIAWLIKYGILDIRIAIPNNENEKSSIYHEKVGIFIDEFDNIVAFSGSLNESSNGWLHNYESFDVFKNWDAYNKKRVIEKEKYFYMLWNNQLSNVNVYQFPEKAIDRIVSTAPEELNRGLLGKTKKNHQIALRDYQLEAIKNWIENDYKGIYEMATGTGKTLAAIYSYIELVKLIKNKVFCIVVCPYKELVNQWERELKNNDIDSIKIYSGLKWFKEVKQEVKVSSIKTISHKCIVTTIDTLTRNSKLNNLIGYIKEPILLICDEVHHWGTDKKIKYLERMNFSYKLGLSATPQKYYDDQITDRLFDIFGNVVYDYPLKKAIKNGYLSKYYYYPVISYMDEDEFSEYSEINQKIFRCYYPEKDEFKVNDYLKNLLIQRSNIINLSKNKLEIFKKIISQENLENEYFNLVFCAKGSNYYKGNYDRQINHVTRILGNELSTRAHRFTSDESEELRTEIFRRFKSGFDLNYIVAIKCLDEGINIPSIKRAFILASSANPMEFVQRRGRILRKSANKEYAEIYDFITLPRSFEEMNYLTEDMIKMERSIIRKELYRIKEFSEIAINSSNKLIFELEKNYKIWE